MNIGYARVLTKGQNLDLQKDALTKAAYDKIYCETVSGAKSERQVLKEVSSDLRPKDVLVAWKLDRLSRSLKHLVKIVDELIERDIGLKSLNDPIDTTTSQGRLIFNIFSSLAEFERDLICERTNAGLNVARARGKVGGRPKGLQKEAEATAYTTAALYKEGNLSVRLVCEKLNISKRTLYSYLKLWGISI